ncbi:hypothetical protein QFC19_009125 [Naganishia cerealis]|uniref:Uncharacterized protein n=1 Tax=Naganishia cerealis TaxID=610337 RepID=A0ACC2UWZ3_9TREE|nr:hypothetical protein QFC19_009125 [Naganishia cerealis]
MTSGSSLTSTRLAALSLSPSRIAQLGIVKSDHEGSTSGEESRMPNLEGRKVERHGEADSGAELGAGSNLLGVPDAETKRITQQVQQESKIPGKAPQRPDAARRTSTLDSLDGDECDEGSSIKEASVMNDLQQAEPSEQVEKGLQQRVVSNLTDKVGDDIGMNNSSSREQAITNSPSHSGAPIPPIQIHITADESTSPVPSHDSSSLPRKPRSPPPSYEHAITPTALVRSSSHTQRGTATLGGINPIMSAHVGTGTTTGARSKGKQRAVAHGTDGDESMDASHTAPSATKRNKPKKGAHQVLLQLLPNSDTDGEDADFVHKDANGPGRASSSSGFHLVAEHLPSSSLRASDQLSERLRPLLVPQQARRRSFTPAGVMPSRHSKTGLSRPDTRRAYTGPVEMVDRTRGSQESSDAEGNGEEDGDGLMTPISGTGTGTGTPDETNGYHLFPTAISPAAGEASLPLPKITKTSPTISSAGTRMLSSSFDGAFTADVYISGWKIIGGKTKRVISPSPRNEADSSNRERGMDSHGHDVVELQKGRLGAYVGTYGLTFLILKYLVC